MTEKLISTCVLFEKTDISPRSLIFASFQYFQLVKFQHDSIVSLCISKALKEDKTKLCVSNLEMLTSLGFLQVPVKDYARFVNRERFSSFRILFHCEYKYRTYALCLGTPCDRAKRKNIDKTDRSIRWPFVTI